MFMMGVLCGFLYLSMFINKERKEGGQDKEGGIIEEKLK
jgi:hypothetical protein